MFWNNSVVIRFEKTSVFFLFILYFLVSLAQQFGKFWFFFHVGCFFSVLHFALEICQFPNYFGISVLCFILRKCSVFFYLVCIFCSVLRNTLESFYTWQIFAIKHESKLSIVFININFTLPHTYFHVKRLKMAKFVLLLLDPHCTGIITEWVLEKF